MGILFDAMSLDGKPSGTRTRLLRLVPELVERGHAVTVAHGPAFDEGARAALKRASLVEVSPPPGPGPLRRLGLQRLVYRRLQREAAPDVVSAETWPMPHVDGLIPVVHDLRYLGLGLPFRALFHQLLRDACERAVRIHTESKTVATQLTQLISLDPARIDVVPIGVPLPDITALDQSDPDTAQPYVLVVGHDEPRKNYSVVAELARALCGSDIRVVRAGRRPGDRVSRGYRAGTSRLCSSSSRLAQRDSGPVDHIGIVTDARRDVLYRHATAVIVPSRLEGYGLVPLEALAAGAVVIASDIPAHREILGDAALFFDPASPDALVAVVGRAMRAREDERADRVHRGRARAAQFSPRHSAEAFEASLAAAGLRP